MSKMQLSKETNKVFWRWYFLGGAGWNYEKMQGLGYYFSTLPLIKKIYKKDDDLKKAAQVEMQFFNTNNTMAPIVLGLDCALQEEKGIESVETLASLKTGMMGPLAGIGDTLFHVIPSTIIGSLASYMALEGNPMALILWIAFGFLRLGFMRSFFKMRYREGAKVVDSVLMPGVLVEEGAEIYKAIVDEGVVIKAKKVVNKEAKTVELVSDNAK